MSLASLLRLSALILAVVAAPVSHATAADADELAIKNYVLTMDKATRYANALAAFEQAKAKDASLAAEQEAAEQETADTLAEYRAVIAKHPRLFAFFRQQGLTPDDTYLLPLGVLTAMIALETGTSVGDVTPANLAFVKQNKAVLQKLFPTK